MTLKQPDVPDEKRSTLPDDPERPVFSSEKVLMDYTTAKGIHQRTGIEKADLVPFILKELLDNAVDFLETYGNNKNEHQRTVKVTLEERKIIVSNSNFERQPFRKTMLVSIFSFDRFYSSKRNIYRISRGNLGDALKEVVCVPYILASDKGIEDWNDSLLLTSNKAEYIVRLKIDRVNQTITPDIQVQLKPAAEQDNGFTDVEVHLPYFGYRQRLIELLMNYSILNPHITFDFNCFSGEFNVLLEQTQDIDANWFNRPSIFYYNLEEFRQLINGLEDNDVLAYDALRSLKFREITNIARDSNATVRNLKENPKRISEFYNALRRTMQSGLKLRTQFDSDRQKRIKAIKKRIEQFGYKISNVKYRLVHENHESDDGQIKFPYIFEFGLFYCNQLSDSCIINGINSSLRYHSPFVGKYRDTYTWLSGKGNKENEANSVDSILAKYGYTTSTKTSRKAPAFIFINLIAPRIDYIGYSKSQIDLEPFQATIAETIYKIASESAPTSDSSGKKITGKDIVKEILTERRNTILRNSDLKLTDRWTQSTVYYRTRKRMLERDIRLTERETITRQIAEICEEVWNVRREELGISAADRAQLYFRGKVYDVNLDEIHNLKQRGTDLIIIEKEGVAEVLSPFAAKYGIAILNTRGFLTDYARDLSELSEHVTILTDLDDSGLVLANKVPDIPRIGIDFETLEYFGLDRETVQEGYKPKDHIKNLKALAQDGEIDEEIEYLLPYIENNRIEIDSVLAEVGNERFWEFVLDKLLELFPSRNYNRAIKTPQDIIPEQVEHFIEELKQKCSEVAASKRKQIETELEDFGGFIEDIDMKDEDIVEEIRNILSQDNDIKSLLSDIENWKRNMTF